MTKYKVQHSLVFTFLLSVKLELSADWLVSSLLGTHGFALTLQIITRLPKLATVTRSHCCASIVSTDLLQFSNCRKCNAFFNFSEKLVEVKMLLEPGIPSHIGHSYIFFSSSCFCPQGAPGEPGLSIIGPRGPPVSV